MRTSVWKNSVSTGRILIKFYILRFFEYLSIEFLSDFIENPMKKTRTLHEDLCMFMIIFCSILRRIRNVSDKICRENQNTHFKFYNVFSKNCAICDIMRKNMVEPGRTRITILHGASALHAG